MLIGRVTGATGAEAAMAFHDKPHADEAARDSAPVEQAGTAMSHRLSTLGKWYEVGNDGEHTDNTRRFQMGTALVSHIALADESLGEAASRYATTQASGARTIDPKRLGLDDVALLREQGLYKPSRDTAALLDEATALHATAVNALKAARRAEVNHEPAVVHDKLAESEVAHQALWERLQKAGGDFSEAAHQEQSLLQGGLYVADAAFHTSSTALMFASPMAMSALAVKGLSLASSLARMGALSGVMSGATQLREAAEPAAMTVDVGARIKRTLYDVAISTQVGLGVAMPFRFMGWLRKSAAATPSIEFAKQMLVYTSSRMAGGFVSASGWSLANHLLGSGIHAVLGSAESTGPEYNLCDLLVAGAAGAVSAQAGYYVSQLSERRALTSFVLNAATVGTESALLGGMRDTSDLLPFFANAVSMHAGSWWIQGKLRADQLAWMKSIRRSDPGPSAAVVAAQRNSEPPRLRVITPTLVSPPVMDGEELNRFHTQMNSALTRWQGAPAYSKTSAGPTAEDSITRGMSEFRNALRRAPNDITGMKRGAARHVLEEIGPGGRGDMRAAIAPYLAHGVSGPSGRTSATLATSIWEGRMPVYLPNVKEAGVFLEAFQHEVASRAAASISKRGLSQKEVDLAALHTLLGGAEKLRGSAGFSYPSQVRDTMYLAGMQPSDAADFLDAMRDKKIYNGLLGKDPHGMQDLIHMAKFKMDGTTTMVDLRDWVVHNGIGNLLSRAKTRDDLAGVRDLRNYATRLGMQFMSEGGGSFRHMQIDDPAHPQVVAHLEADLRAHGPHERPAANVLEWFLKQPPDPGALARLALTPFPRDNA